MKRNAYITKKTFVLGILLCSTFLNAQINDLSSLLQEIEENNQELIAYTSLLESKGYELKLGNMLPNLEVGGYYLPLGGSGKYFEFQVTQTFEFPTVYGARKKLINQENQKLELEYLAKKQTVILEAQKYGIELIALNKKKEIVQARTAQSKKIYEQTQELFETEEIGILELNKAKIAWIQAQFKIQEVEVLQQNTLLKLQNLNGGKEITFTQSVFSNQTTIDPLDQIWESKALNDPDLQLLKQKEAIAEQEIALSKAKTLPDLTTGVNYQGFKGSINTGVYGGVSIPLWNKRTNVKMAQSNFKYQQSNASVQLLLSYVAFQKQYNEYQALLTKYKAYKTALNGLNSDALLLQAYELGELSFIEYYMELQFFRTAVDTMLEMEKQLYLLQVEILKHQLIVQ